ncbi:interleukin-10 receptor subunit beta [Elgaria multicarinata webbii]|uniref:interleukin-10 receptor subunit beta n=1 Tax=Elgaria multicarinata webbii TaxID=159646 RepID=UPI002FCD2191
MAPRGWQCLICSCLFWTVHGMFPEPQNVRIHSVMLDSVLQWDPPNFHKENVTYTVQYKKFHHQYIDLCQRIYITECNISSIPMFGLSTIRVRAEFENKTSNWVDITFTSLKDTNIGPPAVQVEAHKPGVLSVQLTDPFFIRDDGKLSLHDLYGTVIYRLLIWKKDCGGEQVRNENMTHTFQIISGLDPGTAYCLKAQAYIEGLQKTGEWSEDYYIRTADSTDTGINPVQLTVILLSVLILVSFCCFIIYRVYRQTKFVFFPSYSLPQHFKEFLSKPSYSSQFLPSLSQEDDAYDRIMVIPEEPKDGHNESGEQLSNTKMQLQKFQEETLMPKDISNCTLLEQP